jgi:hypothetical protein
MSKAYGRPPELLPVRELVLIDPFHQESHLVTPS